MPVCQSLVQIIDLWWISYGSSAYLDPSLPAKMTCATRLTDIGHIGSWCGLVHEFARLPNLVVGTQGRRFGVVWKWKLFRASYYSVLIYRKHENLSALVRRNKRSSCTSNRLPFSVSSPSKAPKVRSYIPWTPQWQANQLGP